MTRPTPQRLLPDIRLGSCRVVEISCTDHQGVKISARYTGADLVAGMFAEQTVDVDYDDLPRLYPSDAVLRAENRRFHFALLAQGADMLTVTTTQGEAPE